MTDNPWNGGGGFDVNQVANWTPDQIYFRLCDDKVIKSMNKKVVTKEISLTQLGSVATAKRGYVKVRGAEGKLFYSKIGGDGKLIPAEEVEN